MKNPAHFLLATVLVALAILFPPSEARSQTPAPPLRPATEPSDTVDLLFSNSTINEVVEFYEALTNKRLIRDANLTGPNLTIVVNGPVQKKDAISLIESALLLNGYSLVPVDDRTLTILGQGRSPLGQGIPLYADPFLLPQTEELASYFMLLNYISPQDALAVFSSYVAFRPQQSSIVAVPNSNAIVITDTTTLIRRLVALQRFIDVPGARILTEFIPLLRADAEKVAEVINKLLEEERQGTTQGAGGGAAAAAAGEVIEQPGNPDGTPRLTVNEINTIQSLTPLIKVVPDPRTNRILVVAPENRMAYLQRLIRDLDSAVSLEQTLERPLRFVSAGEILPVLQSTLSEGDQEDAQQTNPAGGQQGQGGQGNFNAQGGGGGGSTTGSGGSGAADLLTDPNIDTSPLAVSVGKSRIIADRSTNKIIVIGPPEVREKAAQILDMLDVRPKQIYLATVIGQLTLRDTLEIGFDYLIKFQQLSPDLGGGALLRNRTGTDLLPDPSALIANNVFPALGGLTIYGTIADSVDVFARALASDSNFEIISRPVVYTANNKRAVISSGQERPVPTSTVTSAISGDSTALTSNISFKDVVLKLEVIPLINSENEVTLTIAQQNNQIIDSVRISDNDVPVISTQRLNTTITVKDRSTIVLGGLITEEDANNESGVPLLRDIPVLSYLVGNKRKEKVRSELIILIQPFIIHDEADLAQAQQAMKDASVLDDQLSELQSPEVRRAEAIFPGRPIQ